MNIRDYLAKGPGLWFLAVDTADQVMEVLWWHEQNLWEVRPYPLTRMGADHAAALMELERLLPASDGACVVIYDTHLVKLAEFAQYVAASCCASDSTGQPLELGPFSVLALMLCDGQAKLQIETAILSE